MTPMTLNALVTEIIGLRKTAVVSLSCGRIIRLMSRGAVMNITAK